jgi:hypothetical protein
MLTAVPLEVCEVARTVRRRIMGMRVILAVFLLGLAVVMATFAGQTGSTRRNQQQPDGKAQPGLAIATALRSQVAKLRAEVELLELEHKAERAVLMDLLKEQGRSDSDASRAVKASEAIGQLRILAASMGKLDQFEKESGDEKAMQSKAEEELKTRAESNRIANDRKKQVFLRQAIELNEKRLALAELEKQLANVK